MIRADVITLLSETAHGVFESNTPTETTVFAEIQSVRQKEFYLALNDGIQPEYVFVPPLTAPFSVSAITLSA